MNCFEYADWWFDDGQEMCFPGHSERSSVLEKCHFRRPIESFELASNHPIPTTAAVTPIQ